MAIVKRKPRTPSSRFQSYLSSSDITTTKPHKKLVVGLRKSGGRNAYGRTTSFHKGGGARRLYRVVDFRRSERDIPGKVLTIEYDPNRNVRISLISYANGAKRYMLVPEGLKVGQVVLAGEKIDAAVGNCMPLQSVPLGFYVHNIELTPGGGGKLVRGAGCGAQLMARTDEYATLKMPSGEVRYIPVGCWATIGVLGCADRKNVSIGKAGRTRHMGIRPTVRGMAMNPVDHPHGGGEGRSKSGSHPRTPWGKGCKGTRTRKRPNRLLIRRRGSKKR